MESALVLARAWAFSNYYGIIAIYQKILDATLSFSKVIIFPIRISTKYSSPEILDFFLLWKKAKLGRWKVKNSISEKSYMNGTVI